MPKRNLAAPADTAAPATDAPDSDAGALAAISASVRARLLANPAVMRIPSDKLDAFVARQFLSPKECAALIALIEADRVPSQLLAPTVDPEFRSSESCNLDPELPLVRRIEDRIAGLLGLDLANGETLQGQRYAPGQQFKPHHDYFHRGELYWDEMMRTGGQRTWTAMVFLNSPEGGGETRFPEAGIQLTPRAGNLLAWNNLDSLGNANPSSLHQGCPVTAGCKYIVTKWFRERPWTYSGLHVY